MKTKRSTECVVLMGLGACHGCASGSNLAFHLDFRPQIHRVRIFCGGQRAPMDVWRQWIRHRTANVNEYSTRYSIAIDAAQITPADRWRAQSAENKQGSSGFLSKQEGEKLSASEAELQRLARETYEKRLAVGVAREQARKDLPLSTYTEAYWKIDLHNLLYFLNLRMDDRAQQEIRAYANVIGN